MEELGIVLTEHKTFHSIAQTKRGTNFSFHILSISTPTSENLVSFLQEKRICF